VKILLVEDDKKIVSFLKKGFKEHGFTVDCAQDGKEGLFLAGQQKYDCIVLDIMLPELNGYELIQRLRDRQNKTPVIFLTAKDSVQDRVKGLELGGDDYMIKPFAFSELLARVRAVMRRGKEKEITSFQAGDLMLDIGKHTAMRGDQKINLTPTEFTILQYLMEHKGEVVTKTMLSENVWGYFFDSYTNVIDVHMTNLRKKVDPEGIKNLIHTVRGVGYILEEKE
jgi:heavy metal response regulator